jgi:hypothetical protein
MGKSHLIHPLVFDYIISTNQNFDPFASSRIIPVFKIKTNSTQTGLFSYLASIFFSDKPFMKQIIYYLLTASFAQICTDSYDCLKKGDKYFELGNVSSAVSCYEQSCKQGLEIGCDEYKKIRKLSLIKTNTGSPYISKKNLVLDKAQGIVNSCTQPKSPSNKCIQLSKSLRIEGKIEHAIEIQRYFCEKEDSNACFELGLTFFKNGDSESARTAYNLSCSLGNIKSCDAAGALTSSIDLDEKRTERKRQVKKDDLAESRYQQNQEKIREDSHNKMIQNGINRLGEGIKQGYTAPKTQHCMTKRASDSLSIETDCTEY